MPGRYGVTIATMMNTLQHTCNTLATHLQHTATHLQHTRNTLNTLQHSRKRCTCRDSWRCHVAKGATMATMMDTTSAWSMTTDTMHEHHICFLLRWLSKCGSVRFAGSHTLPTHRKSPTEHTTYTHASAWSTSCERITCMKRNNSQKSALQSIYMVNWVASRLLRISTVSALPVWEQMSIKSQLYSHLTVELTFNA